MRRTGKMLSVLAGVVLSAAALTAAGCEHHRSIHVGRDHDVRYAPAVHQPQRVVVVRQDRPAPRRVEPKKVAPRPTPKKDVHHAVSRKEPRRVEPKKVAPRVEHKKAAPRADRKSDGRHDKDRNDDHRDKQHDDHDKRIAPRRR